jgi:hypothetical protein
VAHDDKDGTREESEDDKDNHQNSDDHIIRDADFRTERAGRGRPPPDLPGHIRRIEGLLRDASPSSLTADELSALDELFEVLRALLVELESE